MARLPHAFIGLLLAACAVPAHGRAQRCAVAAGVIGGRASTVVQTVRRA